jgi:hypothetical protein
MQCLPPVPSDPSFSLRASRGHRGSLAESGDFSFRSLPPGGWLPPRFFQHRLLGFPSQVPQRVQLLVEKHCPLPYSRLGQLLQPLLPIPLVVNIPARAADRHES